MAGESILIVDDDTFMRELLGESLQETEYRVETAVDGKDALHKLSLHEYQVALIDLSLEDMSGLDIVDTLIDGSPDTRIIIMTGYPSIQSAIDALRRGAQDYIIKPFKMPEIQAAVARSLRVQKLEVEVRALRRRVREQEQEISRLKTGAPTRPGAARPGATTPQPVGMPVAYGSPPTTTGSPPPAPPTGAPAPPPGAATPESPPAPSPSQPPVELAPPAKAPAAEEAPTAPLPPAEAPPEASGPADAAPTEPTQTNETSAAETAAENEGSEEDEGQA